MAQEIVWNSQSNSIDDKRPRYYKNGSKGFVNAFGEYDFVAFCKKRLDLVIPAESGKGERFSWIQRILASVI